MKYFGIIRKEICWLPLLVMALTAVLWPCSILAQAEKIDLTLNIVYDGFSSLKAGEEKTVFLEVGNTGYKELTNIRLTADSPEGWTIEFNPKVIDKLASGSFQTVDIMLKPADNEAKGDYNVAVIAQANETRRVTSIYVRVESSSLFWVWVGAGVAALLIAGFVVIFMRFGREE
ncbi:MAG: NEW3 domain-containing protein [Dehalococcoidia bacterium]|nr:NEW3 domain-containing protein [Dehalococcoidia bacterium]